MLHKTWDRFEGVSIRMWNVACVIVVVGLIGLASIVPGVEAVQGSFYHPTSRFRIAIPENWTADGNATLGSGQVDVLMRGTAGSGRAVSLFVLGESRSVQGTGAAARAVLQEVLDALSTSSGYRVMGPITEGTIRGHASATAMISTQPSTYDVHQILTVVVAPEWSRDWAIVGTMFQWDTPAMGPVINGTTQTFDVVPAPGAGGLSIVIVATLLIAVAVVGSAVVLVFLRSRKKQVVAPPANFPTPFAPPPPPPPPPEYPEPPGGPLGP